MKATIERPADGVEQPAQNKPYSIVHLGVANEIIQNNADIAVIIVVIISTIVSLISIMFILVIHDATNADDDNKLFSGNKSLFYKRKKTRENERQYDTDYYTMT